MLKSRIFLRCGSHKLKAYYLRQLHQVTKSIIAIAKSNTIAKTAIGTIEDITKLAAKAPAMAPTVKKNREANINKTIPLQLNSRSQAHLSLAHLLSSIISHP